MRLYWERPPEGEAFGRLVDENGEAVEGVMVQDVFYSQDDLVSVRFTVLIDSVSALDETAVHRAVTGLRGLEASLSVP